MTEKKWIAVLDANSRLIGKIQVALTVEGVDPGDLPTNGLYKWDGTTFNALGFGFGKVKVGNPPHTLEMVIARILEKMGDNAPSEGTEWLAWYNSDLRIRETEAQESRAIRNKR